jgi:hypothetical protein
MYPNIEKKNFIIKEIGLWIDHRKAVVVIVSDKGEEVKEITSHMEKHVRYSDDTSEGGALEYICDRQFDNRLNAYYDTAVAAIRDGDSVQIFSPGEAKGELKKRLESGGYKGYIMAIETVDKGTDRQIAVKVREQIRKK